MTAPTHPAKSKAKQWAQTVTHRSLLKKISLSSHVVHSISQPLYNLLESSCSAPFLESVIMNHLDLLNAHTNHFVRVLELLYDYQITEETCKFAFSLLREIAAVDWVAKIDQAVSSMLFQPSDKNPIDLAIHRIAASSSSLSFEQLKPRYENVVESYRSISEKLMDKKDVKLWAEKVKSSSLSNCSFPQSDLIAGVQRAVELHHEFSPRGTQILSLISLLNPKAGMGRLAQINTGEGKSLIVAMLAAIHALQGKKVDVITTSTELSIPEVEKQKSFFDSLCLTVAENSNMETKSLAYESDVVYGVCGDFQADILRAQFKKNDIRGTRGFNIVIVDEVDSMLFDNRSHSVRLSEQLPGMNHLEVPLAAVWKLTLETVERLTSKELEVEDMQAYVTEIIQRHLEQLLRDLNDEERKEYGTWKVLDNEITVLDEAIAHITDDEEKMAKIADLKSLMEKWKKHPWNSRHNQVLEVPIYLRDFARSEIPYWIRNALNAAYRYKKDADYIIQNDRIVPVHFNETGVLQANMVWGDGLTQFLQLKEGLPMDPEGVSTNFISNVSFFKRYDDHIYGVTGTLGEDSTKDFLCKTYHTDTIIIPPYQRRNIIDNEYSRYACKELISIVLADEMKWYQTVVDRALCHAKLQRAVLVICKFICQVKYLSNELRKKYKSKNIFSYTGEEPFDKPMIDSGEIIIATNIAGRGIDLETSPSVESHGGMYVAITFLPETYRVGMQNVGRTARSGKKGMAQLIVFDTKKSDILDIKNDRNKQEVTDTEKAIQDAEKNLIQDRLFSDFCSLENQYLPAASVCDGVEKWDELTTAWQKRKAEELSSEKIAKYVQRRVHERKEELIQCSLEALSGEEARVLRKSDKQTYLEKIARQATSELEEQYYEMILNDFCKNQSHMPEVLIACLKEGRDFNPERPDLAKKYHWGMFERKGFEEALGFWLKGQHFEEKKVSQEEALKLFNSGFAARAKDWAEEDSLVRNPYFYVLKGNTYLLLGNLSAANVCYDRAIDMDPDFSANALYNKAYALLSYEDNKGDRQKQAYEALKKAKRIIGTIYRPSLLLFCSLIAQQKNRILTSQHAQHQLNLISQQENYIDKACSVIKDAQSKDCHVKLTTQLISETLHPDDQESHIKAISEAGVNGFTHLFTIKKINPVPWGSVVGLALISLAQITAGCLIRIFSQGTLGMCLIEEGVFDFIDAIKCAIQRSFDRGLWAMQKSIRLAVSIVSLGVKAAEGGVDGAKAALKKAFGTKGVISVEKGIKAAAMEVGATSGKGVFKELTTSAADWCTNKIFLEKYEKNIRKKAEEQILEALQNNPLVAKALELDVANRNNCWQNFFVEQGLLVLKEEQELENGMKAMCAHMMLEINRGVTANVEGQISDTISNAAVLTARIEKALEPLLNYTNKFMEKFNEKVQSRRSAIESAVRKASQSASSTATATDEILLFITPSIKSGETDIINIHKKETSAVEANTFAIQKFYRPQGPSNSQSVADVFKDFVTRNIVSSLRKNVVTPAINWGSKALTDTVFQGVDEIIVNFRETAIRDQLDKTREESKRVNKELSIAPLGQEKIKHEESNGEWRQQEEDKPGADFKNEKKIQPSKYSKIALERLRNNEPMTAADIALACDVLGVFCEFYDKKGILLDVFGEGLPGEMIKLTRTEVNGREHYEPLDSSIQTMLRGDIYSLPDVMLAQLSSNKRKALEVRDGNDLRKLMRKCIKDDPDIHNRVFEAQHNLARITTDKLMNVGEWGPLAQGMKHLMVIDEFIEASPKLKELYLESVRLAKATGLMKKLSDGVKNNPYLLAGVMVVAHFTHDFYNSIIAEIGIDPAAVKKRVVDYLQTNIDPNIECEQALWAADACFEVIKLFRELAEDMVGNFQEHGYEAREKKVDALGENLPELGTAGDTSKNLTISAHEPSNGELATEADKAIKKESVLSKVVDTKYVKNVMDKFKSFSGGMKGWFGKR